MINPKHAKWAWLQKLCQLLKPISPPCFYLRRQKPKRSCVLPGAGDKDLIDKWLQGALYQGRLLPSQIEPFRAHLVILPGPFLGPCLETLDQLPKLWSSQSLLKDEGPNNLGPSCLKRRYRQALGLNFSTPPQ